MGEIIMGLQGIGFLKQDLVERYLKRFLKYMSIKTK